MINDTRFSVETESFYEKLNDLFKTIPSRSYGKNLKLNVNFAHQ